MGAELARTDRNIPYLARGVTRTAVFSVSGCRLAAFSSRSHVSFRSSATKLTFACSSVKWSWQAWNSGSSISVNIFLTFRVELSTDWFQWLWTFLSSAGIMIGRITCRLCAIRSTIWSLFQKNNALSATWNYFICKTNVRFIPILANYV